MKENFNRGGRPPKLNPAVYRYVVRFDAAENSAFLAMFDKAQALNKASFIKNLIFGKPFKVFTVDENTRVFIDKLSSLNSLYRTLGVDYDLLVKTLRENFTEKKAMTLLYKLERATLDLVRLTTDVMSLSEKFDEQWSQKSR